MRTQRFISLLVSAGAVSANVPESAQAWGGEDYSVIAQITSDNLPQIGAQVDAIQAAAGIRCEYNDLDHRSGRMRHRECRANTLEQLASWANCVRYNPGPHFSPTGAHNFDDAPLCGTPVADQPAQSSLS